MGKAGDESGKSFAADENLGGVEPFEVSVDAEKNAIVAAFDQAGDFSEAGGDFHWLVWLERREGCTGEAWRKEKSKLFFRGGFERFLRPFVSQPEKRAFLEQEPGALQGVATARRVCQANQTGYIRVADAGSRLLDEKREDAARVDVFGLPARVEKLGFGQAGCAADGGNEMVDHWKR